LRQIGGDGADATFRLLADNMPALRKLEFSARGQQPSQDGFIELISRLRSLSLRAGSHPWASVADAGPWPLALPNLEELRWWAGDGVDAVAVALLRRAVSLRAAQVSHASALAAIAAGPAADVAGSGDLPLSSVQTLTLGAIINDPVSLTTTLAASPGVSAVGLRWTHSASEVWDLLRAAASAAPLRVEDRGLRRVRRVQLEVNRAIRFDSHAAAQCVRALFPRARYMFLSKPFNPKLLLE
jgi:hypothetical protein